MAENNTISDEQALQDFLLDIECLDKLLPWTGKFNLFDVLKVSRNEIRHSNVLGWLLDPNENHGMGDAFLKGVLQRMAENDSDGRYDVFKVLRSDMYSFSVYREWKNIDILLVSSEEKLVIAIENKVGSHEHSNQLNRYREILENDYDGYKRLYVYLTPDGEEPSDVSNWDVLTYTDVVEVIENIYNRMELQPDISLMIRNYIEIIRRDIVEEQQLIDICNKIYNKHRKALDLIYANRTDGRTQMADAIVSALEKLNDDGIIIHGQDWGNMVFRTSEMDEVLPLLENPDSSWGTLNVYSYWFNFRESSFYAVFELGGWNVPEQEMQMMNRIIDELKPNDNKRDNFRYKRVFRTKWYELNEADDIEAEAYKAVSEAVSEIKAMEGKLIAAIK